MELPDNAAELLAQPTRARLFAVLESLNKETSTDELAALLGLHVNGVRRHLELMHDAGLLERKLTRGARGRPRDEWTIAASAAILGERPGAYHALARWLARAIPSGPRGLRQVERAGREIGRELAPTATADPGAEFERTLAVLGFKPEVEIDAEGAVCCELGNCPYRDSVRENQALVCTLHKGLTAGLLDELAPEARLSKFEPHDPDQAGCLVEVAGTNWAAQVDGQA